MHFSIIPKYLLPGQKETEPQKLNKRRFLDKNSN